MMSVAGKETTRSTIVGIGKVYHGMNGARSMIHSHAWRPRDISADEVGS
jgi:hypothetical protein